MTKLRAPVRGRFTEFVRPCHVMASAGRQQFFGEEQRGGDAGAMTSINFKKDEWMSCLKFESVRARCAGRLAAMARRALAVFALAALAAGCVTRADDLAPDKDLMSVPVGAVGHYGAKIGIPDFYLNGRGIRSVSGWGGCGAGACFVLLPRNVTK